MYLLAYNKKTLIEFGRVEIVRSLAGRKEENTPSAPGELPSQILSPSVFIPTRRPLSGNFSASLPL